jgi:hypothetical protein
MHQSQTKLTVRGPVHSIPSVLVQKRRSMRCMRNPGCGTLWDWRQAGYLSLVGIS